MNISIVLTQMCQLLIMMFLGFLLYRSGAFTKDFNKRLTSLILHVTLPCMVLNSVLQQTEDKNPQEALWVFLIALLLYLFLPAAGFVIVKLLRLPKASQGLYIFMVVYSNIGFMGFPMIQALYGDGAVFYTAIFNIIFNLSVFTAGVAIMHYGIEGQVPFSPKSLLSPGVISSVLAVVIYFLDIRFPAVLTSVIHDVGVTTTPLAMILIGSTLGTMELREVFRDWRIYPYVAVKQLVLPLLCWPALTVLIANPFIRGITFLMILMPIANTAVLFATSYGSDDKLAARAVFVSTILSLFTIPLALYICPL